MAHVMQPNQSRQSTGDNSQDDTRRDRRSTNSGTHSGHRLIPKDIKFGGTSDEDVTAFINSLIRYATYVHLSDDDLCDLFPLTLSNRAEFWFQSLPSSITKNWTRLSNTYLEKYGPSSRGFVHEVALLERVQNPNESIDAYASDLINRFQMTGTREPERWKTFVRGLQPELKAFVLDKGCSTFDEAETLAKKAEQLKFITSPVGQTSIAAVRAHENPPSKREDHRLVDSHQHHDKPRCLLCDKIGHDVSRCWSLPMAQKQMKADSDARQNRFRNNSNNSGTNNGYNQTPHQGYQHRGSYNTPSDTNGYRGRQGHDSRAPRGYIQNSQYHRESHGNNSYHNRRDSSSGRNQSRSQWSGPSNQGNWISPRL